MLVTGGFLLIGAWILGLLGVFGGGDLKHMLLLVGLLLLMLGALKGRGAALHGDRSNPSDGR